MANYSPLHNWVVYIIPYINPTNRGEMMTVQLS